jgi:hypothetical protein
MDFKTFLEQKTHELIIPKGKEFYHGTIEEFDPSVLRTGIDHVFWTSINKNTSRSYIPTSGSSVYLQTDSIINPSEDTFIQNLQKSIGIYYDYSNVVFTNGRPSSYTIPDIFKDYYTEEQKIYKRLTEISKRLAELRPTLEKYDSEDFDKAVEEYGRLEDEQERLREEQYKVDSKSKKREYVNSKLSEYGYTPEKESHYDNNHGWKLLQSNIDTLAPADYKAKGRLITVAPKRDMNIYDMTAGETIEPDLMDAQHKKYDTFITLRDAGYDGVKIADHAQHDTHGNVGHYSYGFFDAALKDLEVVNVEDATHPDTPWE